VEQGLLNGAVAFSRVLGDRGAAGFGAAVGKLGYFPLRIRRELVYRNLRASFPEKDDAWIERIARATYAHLGREALMIMRMLRMTSEDLMNITRDTGGLEDFRGAVNEGRGVVLVAGHFGNHEIGAAATAIRGIPLDVVVQRQGNPLFDNALNKARRRFGLGVIERSQAPRLALKALREGRAVGFAADQDAGKSGVFVPFFGRLASTHRGAALMAVKTGAPLFVAGPIRIGDRYEGAYVRVDVDRSGPLDDVVYRLTAAFTAELERLVRAYPEQYLWLHRRWKTPPPPEPQTSNSV
jgi:KDO2-lipid IV(A) lauroyltransferase